MCGNWLAYDRGTGCPTIRVSVSISAEAVHDRNPPAVTPAETAITATDNRPLKSLMLRGSPEPLLLAGVFLEASWALSGDAMPVMAYSAITAFKINLRATMLKSQK